MDANDGGTVPFEPPASGPRKRARKEPRGAAKEGRPRERMSLNLTIGRKARILLAMHAEANKGTPEGTVSAIVEGLVLRNLRWLRASDMAPEGSPGPEAESA